MNLKKSLKIGLITISVIGMLTIAGGSLYIGHTLQSLPPIDAVYLNTYGATQITDKNGNVIYEDTKRVVQSSTYEELPELYKKGLVEVEDKDFWTSSGYSLKGMLHALTRKRGGSTIEQQLIKNTYYNGGRGYNTINRKIHEVFLAKQMDENISKEQILTYYMNKLELGEGAVGIKAAMKVYFDKTPDQYNENTPENVSQLAYLVGLGQAPTTYDLYTGDDGLERKNLVLSIWNKNGLITNDEYQQAKTFDLKTSLAPRYHTQEKQKETNKQYQDYATEVLKEVKDLGYDLSKTTLKIKTHLDPDLYNKIKNTVLNAKYLDNNQQVGVAVINSEGIVVGMVGGRDTNSEWNRATQNTRSSGSSMKPFTAYGPLLQYFGNQYNTASHFDSSPYRYPGTNLIMYNYARASYGMIDMQQALRWSLNTPVARIDDNILGSTRMKTFLAGLGLDVKDEYSANDGIGLNISPLQSAAAYNAINNGGIYTKPRFVDKITFVDGTEKTIEPRRNRAMNESVAYVLAQMLRGVPKASIGSALDASIPQFSGYAGKTGSVAFEPGVNRNTPYGEGSSDAWYASFTNGGYSVVLWTGYDVPNTSPQIPDSYKGQQILGKQLQLMLNEGRNVPNWTKPDSVRQLFGSDISAHYAVTDAGDIANPSVNIPPLPNLDIKSIVPSVIIDTKWMYKIPTKEKNIVKYYNEKPSLFEERGVITDEIHKIITGGAE